MVQTISRMYASSVQANKAFSALDDHGYDDLHIVSGPQTGEDGTLAASPSREDIVAALHRAFIPKSQAAIYADRIAQGRALVTVHALFGTALKARDTLDSFDPIDSGVADEVHEVSVWNDALPMSSALQMPVLTATKLPFEAMWNVPSLTRGRVFFSDLFGLPLLARSATPFSKLLGAPLLSFRRTPFSSQLGLPLLTQK